MCGNAARRALLCASNGPDEASQAAARQFHLSKPLQVYQSLLEAPKHAGKLRSSTAFTSRAIEAHSGEAGQRTSRTRAIWPGELTFVVHIGSTAAKRLCGAGTISIG